MPNSAAGPTWTCAPYQLAGGPGFGDHIAVGESNAVAYYNSVTGARTNKYGDYLDVACALTGLAPDAGLHRDAEPQGSASFRLHRPSRNAGGAQDIFAHLIGHHVGRISGRRSPVITGLCRRHRKDASEGHQFRRRRLGRRRTLAWRGRDAGSARPRIASSAAAKHIASPPMTCAAPTRELSTARDGPLDAVALGTPHFSFSEFAELVRLLDGRKVKPGLPFLVSTSRAVRDTRRGARAGSRRWKQPASKSPSTSAPIIRRACAASRAAS